jgi:hypothetical protein
MASPESFYRGSVRAFSVVLVAIGLAILVSALANGGGPASIGVLMGIAFVVVGGGRLWIAARMSR